jgi:hypothetical protein
MSLAIALSVAEILARLRPELQPERRWNVGERAPHASRNFEPDSVTGWRLKANHSFVWHLGGDSAVYSSNAQGMRAPEDFPHTCGGRRIVMVGDSFFFGTGVSIGKTVASQLADSLSHRFDVYNVAMPGFGIDQLWMSLRHNALPLCPALIVVGFVDDDWNRSLTAYRTVEEMTKPTFVLEGDSLRPQRPSDKPGAVKSLVLQHSALWRAVEVVARRLSYRTGRGEWFRLNAAMLEAMARDARSNGVPILFVRLPARDGWRSLPALRTAMARIPAPYIDLADPSAVRSDIHFPGDAHLNALGDAYVAGKIAEWIRSAGPETAGKSQR